METPPMHHRRDSDAPDADYDHVRQGDGPSLGIDVPKRVDIGRVITFAISLVTSLTIGVSSWFALQYRVEAATERIARAELRVAKIESDEEKSREVAAQTALALAHVADQLSEVNRRLDDLKADVHSIEHGKGSR